MSSKYFEHYDEIGPEIVVQVYDPISGMRGVVVIDTLAYGITGGGVRMLPDITTEEIVRLARTMTYKFAVLNIPVGGAKGGIWHNPNARNRDEIVEAFGRTIKHLLISGVYAPGADMGTSDADVIKFYEIAGLKDLAPSGLALKVRDGLPLGDQFTGYGVIVAAKTACRYADIDFEGATVAIEGFGKVGAGAARFASRMGARVVAVSTIEGGVYNPEGLDIENMIKLREKYGDACVLKYDGAERIDKEKIFELPVDILIPGARPDVINKNNVDRIKARVISEAANIPVTDEAERILFERGVVSAPDIVANSGGVISEVLERASGGSIDENRIFENIERMISSLLDDIFQNSLEQGVNPRELSIRIAKRRVIDRIQEERGRERPEIERIRDSIKKRFKL